MGEKLRNALKTEVGKLKTERIKSLVEKILDECDDNNAIGPASSSGKYHPKCDLGDGGLIRHTKIVCRNVETCLQACPKYDNDEDWDVVYGAAILHDMCKFREDLEHSFMSHPVDMSAKIREHNKRKNPEIERLAKCVETHMSRFTKSSPDGKGEPLPTPANMEQMIIPFADMIASRKWFYAEFDENGELVENPYHD